MFQCVMLCFSKQKTAYEMRISDWSSDVCSSDLRDPDGNELQAVAYLEGRKAGPGGDIVSHITLGSDDLGRSGAFYEGLLAPLGLVRLPTEESENVDHAFGHAGCSLPVVFPQKTFDGRPAAPGHGTYPVLREIGRPPCRDRLCQYV